MAFYDAIINKLFHIQTTTAAVVEDEGGMPDVLSKKRRKRRSVQGETSKNALDTSKEEVDENDDQAYVYIQYQREGPIKPISVKNSTMTVANKFTYMQRIFVTVPGNQTSLMVDNLKHYSKYEVRVHACQKEQTSKENKVYRVCSDDAIVNPKTAAEKDADTILPWNGDEEIDTHFGNSSEVTFIRWLPPQNPNERIVNYVLAWSKDTSQTKPYVRCISMSEITQVNVSRNGVQRTMLQYKLVTEGEYYIRLKAVSLYEDGKWTRWQVRMIVEVS